MSSTKHLTVFHICCSAFAPSGNVICIHFGYFPYTFFVVVAADSAERTVRHILCFCLFGLLCINRLFGRLVKDTDVKELVVGAAAEDVFVNALFVLYIKMMVDTFLVSTIILPLQFSYPCFCLCLLSFKANH